MISNVLEGFDGVHSLTCLHVDKLSYEQTIGSGVFNFIQCN